MISRNILPRHALPWREALAQAISDPRELLNFLNLAHHPLASSSTNPRFPLRVPRGYAARMRKGDPDDPLLRQVMPTADEDRDVPGYTHDPVADHDAVRRPGLLHKYHGRVLLLTTGACAVHCRYCFRQHFPYGDSNPLKRNWDAVMDYIAADRDIREVILSGGDPLTLADSRLAALAGELSAVPHVARLRIHTRLPVVLPERVDDALLAWLGAVPLNTVMVIHANHGNEIDGRVRGALLELKRTGVTLLNQAVLLRGVNDNTGALAQLSESLFEAGVLPYYLHMLDKTTGTVQFEVADATARALMASLRETLPGYLVPRLVREEAGAPGKVPLFP